MDIKIKPLPDVLALLPGPHLLRRLEAGSVRNAQGSVEEDFDEALRLEYELAVLKAKEHHPAGSALERAKRRHPSSPAPVRAGA